MANDGGSAFPMRGTADSNYANTPSWRVELTGGMSLRDYFAAQGLPAILTYMLSDAYDGASRYEDVAHDAYLLADAMLKARESSHV